MDYSRCLIFDRNTDAEATNRGFIYQYLLTLKLWLTNYKDKIKNYELFCEVEDDLKLVESSSNKVMFEQVKCYSKNFSLKSIEVKKSLLNFIILFTKYSKTMDVQFRFTTNTGLSKTDRLFEEWLEKQQKFDKKLDKEKLDNIKAVLISIIEEEASKKIQSEKSKESKRNNKDKDKLQLIINKIEESKAYIINQLRNDELFISFVNRIEFSFINIESEKIINIEKEAILGMIKEIDNMKATPKIVFSRLLSEIYFRSSESIATERVLSDELLESILDETADEMLSNTKAEFQNIVSILSEQTKKIDYDIELNERIDVKVNKILETLDSKTSLSRNINKHCLNYYDEEQLDDVEKRDLDAQR